MIPNCYAFNPTKDVFHNSDQKKLTSIKLSTIGQVFVCVHVCACMLSHFSLADSLHDPMDCSLPASSVYGILQARILEWVTMPSSRDLSNPGIKPMSPAAPALQMDSLLLSHHGSPCVHYVHIFIPTLQMRNGESDGTPLQYSCLENPMDGGAWQAAVHGAAKSQTQLSNFTFTFHFHALERKWQPTPVFLPGESQGRGSLMGCRLWGHTESDMTEETQQQQQKQQHR